GVDPPGPAAAGHVGSSAHTAGRRDHVTEDDRDLVLQRTADQVGLLRLRGAGAALVHDGDRPAEFLLVQEGPLDAALVRAEDHEVAQRDIQAADVLVDDRAGVQVIDRDVEKALDLGGVQVEGQDPVGPGDGQQVGHQLGGDRHPADVLAVLPGVAVVRQYGGDAGGAGPLETVEHDQQFGQVVVHRRAGRLHDEDVPAAHVLLDAHGDFAVGKVRQRDL